MVLKRAFGLTKISEIVDATRVQAVENAGFSKIKDLAEQQELQRVQPAIELEGDTPSL